MGINIFTKDFLYYASLGHKIESVDPKVYSNVLGYRKGISVLNTEKIKENLFVINEFLKSVISEEKSSLLFVNLNESSKNITRFCALRSVEPFIVKNWSSGALTNVLSSEVDVIFVLSVKNNHFIVQEANKLNIPVVGLVDNDSNPNMVSFPLLLNDNSVGLDHAVTSLVSNVVLEIKLLNYGLLFN